MRRRPLPPRARPRAAPRIWIRRAPGPGRRALLAAAAGLAAGAIGLAGVAAVLAPPAPAAAGEDAVLYRWTDKRGAVRYTPDPGRIPRARRAQAQPVRPGEPPPVGGAAPGETPPPDRPGASDADAPVPRDPPSPPEPRQPVETGAPVRESGAPEADPGDLDARIRELEASIERDQQTLRAMIARPAPEGGDSLAESPELREIARRLPALQAELRRLRDQRAAQQRP